MIQKITVGLLVVLCVLVGGLYFVKTVNLGASVGTEHYNIENFYAGFTATGAISNTGNTTFTGTLTAATSTLGNLVSGNGVLALTVVATTTAQSITAAQFCGNGVITVTTPAQTTSTLTFPVATSTFATCMTNLGSRKFLSIYNASSSGFTVTIASSTGITMVKPFNVSSTFTVTGGGTARLELNQITSSTATLTVEQMQ